MTYFDGSPTPDPFEGLGMASQMRRMLTVHADMSLANAAGLGKCLENGSKQPVHTAQMGTRRPKSQ